MPVQDKVQQRERFGRALAPAEPLVALLFEYEYRCAEYEDEDECECEYEAAGEPELERNGVFDLDTTDLLPAEARSFSAGAIITMVSPNQEMV